MPSAPNNGRAPEPNLSEEQQEAITVNDQRQVPRSLPTQSYSHCACSALLLVLLPLLFAACPKNQKPPRQPRIGISTGSTPEPLPIPTAFNGERALDHVRKQIEFGPRPPGSPQLEKTREYIVKELKSYGFTVTVDEFTAKTPHGDKKMANITGELRGESKTAILIGSHYETKFYKDMHFVGANDPAASVATVLEIGRVVGSLGENKKSHSSSCSSTAKKLSAKDGPIAVTLIILTTLTAAAIMCRS